MQTDKVLSMVGLAKRAGKVTTGAPLCDKEIKAKRARLVIIAADISEKGKKAITDACTFYSVDYIVYSDMYTLGKAVGAESVRTVVTVNDNGFAEAIMKKYDDLQTGRNGE